MQQLSQFAIKLNTMFIYNKTVFIFFFDITNDISRISKILFE